MSAQFLEWKRIVVTVATAGSAVRVSATPLWVRSLIVQAHYLNGTTIMLMGDSAANAAQANAHALAPGDSLAFSGNQEHARQVQLDLSSLWVDASANGGKLIVSYYQEVL